MNRRFSSIANELNRLAAAAGRSDRVTAADVEAIFTIGRYQCAECRRYHSELHPLTVAHIFPLGPARIGRNVASNLRLCCPDRCEQERPAPVVMLSSHRRQRATLHFVHVNAAA